MVVINNITEEPCFLYSPNNELIGEIKNSLILIDVQMQIAKEKADGYYIIFRDEKYLISNKGEVINWPKGLFDMVQRYFVELCKIR